jgi:hypothetical protein
MLTNLHRDDLPPDLAYRRDRVLDLQVAAGAGIAGTALSDGRFRRPPNAASRLPLRRRRRP